MSEIDPLRAAAARISGCAELLDVRLVSMSVVSLNFSAPDATLGFQVEISPEASHAEGTEALGVTVAFTVEVFEADEDGERRTEIARIECRYAALFVCDLTPPAQAAEIDAFARTVGVMALYPYARAAIQDATSRMGLPPLTMGIYRIPIDDPERVAD
jgi:preprotein translocase subunit SecB